MGKLEEKFAMDLLIAGNSRAEVFQKLRVKFVTKTGNALRIAISKAAKEIENRKLNATKSNKRNK